MFRVAFVCVVVALGACATTPAYVPQPLPADAPLPMWRVEKDGRAAGFLFGTFHALPEKELLDRRVFRALRGADALVIELSPELDDAHKEALERFTAERGVYPNGEPGLDQRMPAAEYKELADAASKAGVPGFVFVRMRPWLATVVVSMGAATDAGFDPENSAESQLIAGRGNNPAPIVELETAEEQLEALASIDESLLFEDMSAPANEDPIAALRQLYEAWHRGDTAEIERLTYAPMRENPKLAPMYEAMFLKRNDAMAAKIKARLEAGGRPFVAVGCGHMVGPRGLVAQLTAAGYTLTQVRGAAEGGASALPISTGR